MKYKNDSPIPIYPAILVRDKVVESKIDGTYVSFTLATTLRKEHEGKYYLCDFFETKWLPVGDEKKNEREKLDTLGNFHASVYRFLIVGQIDPSITFPSTGEQLFKPDPNQTPEAERVLQNTIPNIKKFEA